MKKRMKMVAAMLMTAAVAMGSFAGCGSSQPAQTSKPAGTESASEAAQEEQQASQPQEVKHIIMTILTGGTDQTDADKIQAAVNEISVPELGVEVEFKQVSLYEAPSQVPMWIGAGEEIDLYACAFTGISPFIDMNMLEPLDDLLAQYGQGILEIADAGAMILDGTKKDATYGVRTLATIEGRRGGYFLRKDAMEAAGFSYQQGDMITLDDLDEIFAKEKELYPDCYQGILGSLSPAGYTMVSDALGATTASGVVIGTDSTEVVNYYATEEYKNYLEHVRSWNQNGYLLKDAATTDVSLNDSVNNGTFLGYFTEGNAGLLDTLNKSNDFEWITVMLNDVYLPSTAPQANTYWTIPVTAAEPEAAMKFLNAMMTDERICNLLMWGIENDHYTYNDETGLTAAADASGRWSLPGLHGNQRIMLGQAKEVQASDEIWNEAAAKNKTKGCGFAYNAANMTNQITAVTAVITEYQAALETGSADLETVYPEFLAKLEANGINEIIADKQAQFDEWLAQQ